MKKYIYFILTLIALSSCGQGLSPEASKLFTGVKSTLSEAEKNKIAEESGFKLGEDGKTFEMETEPVDINIYPVDLNNDKSEEIFIIISSSFLYGNTGQGFNLLAKDKTGKYVSIFAAPGIPGVIENPGAEYPSLLLGGPGFVFPIYVWKDGKYEQNGESNGENLQTLGVEALSEKYVSTIK